MRSLLLTFLRLTSIIALAFIAPLVVLSAQQTKKGKFTAKGSAVDGEAAFKKYCTMCHYPDRVEKKLGPGLKDLFKNKELPQSHKPVNAATIRQQIEKGSQAMPAFANKLTPAELNNLLVYLKTL